MELSTYCRAETPFDTSPKISSTDILSHSYELIHLYHDLLSGEKPLNLEKLRFSFKDALSLLLGRMQSDKADEFKLNATKYIYCSLFDEAVLNLSDIDLSDWQQRSLLSESFDETFGGETFFKLRQYCVDHLYDQIDVLELIYVCICFGFKGQYALIDRGQHQLDQICRESYELIRRFKGEALTDNFLDQWVAPTETIKRPKWKVAFFVLIGTALLFTLFYLTLIVHLRRSEQSVQHRVTELIHQLQPDMKDI